jgi:hypothetical protein
MGWLDSPRDARLARRPCMSTQPVTLPLSGQMRAMHSVCQMLAQISPSMNSSCGVE